MSLERESYNGPITFCCDNCGEIEETHCSDFTTALVKVKAHDWKARKIDGDWQHFCYDCKPPRKPLS